MGNELDTTNLSQADAMASKVVNRMPESLQHLGTVHRERTIACPSNGRRRFVNGSDMNDRLWQRSSGVSQVCLLSGLFQLAFSANTKTNLLIN